MLKFIKTFSEIFLPVFTGVFMFVSGYGHLFLAAEEIELLVPARSPISPKAMVIVTGYIEITIGLAFIFLRSKIHIVGWILVVFLILVFPGNLYQYSNDIDAFGLNTPGKRLARLFLQPFIILWVLYVSGNLNKLIPLKTNK